MWYVRRVDGDSMAPAYKDGQLVLVSTARDFRIGDVVVAFIDKREVLKRVIKSENGHVFLEGDNRSASTDSRQYGWIVDSHITAKVIFPRKKAL